MAKGERRQFPPFNIINLLFIQGPALLDSIPFLNAFPAAGGGCMLGNEYRMPPPRCLFAIIPGKIRRNSGIYKLKRVLSDGFKTFGGNVISILLS
jgi:hypothetical protein